MLIWELIENAFDWGKANNVTIKHSEGQLYIKDDSLNGFGSQEALKRFFHLGERNKEANGKTIGRYGKGGYKSLIALATEILIISKINNNFYKIGTNFDKMINNDSLDPTISLVKEKSLNVKSQTLILIKLNPEQNGTLIKIHLDNEIDTKTERPFIVLIIILRIKMYWYQEMMKTQ